MTGEELRDMRVAAGVTREQLGKFLGWRGTPLTIDRNVRKLEQQNHIFPEVARNVRKFFAGAREGAS